MRMQRESLTDVQKAAALLTTLGESTGAQVIRHLDEDEIQKVTQSIACLPQLGSGQAQEVLEEFKAMMMAEQFIVKGGLEYARSMLFSAFGPEAANRLISRIEEKMAYNASNLDTLRKADPTQLAKFIHNEHPQTIALVLSHLSPTQAAALLTSLPQEIRTEVAMRMAHIDQISPDIIHRISGVIDQKLRTLGEFSRESYGGVRAVADMINRLDMNVGKEILSGIETEDGVLFGTIRHLMFVFEDVMQLDVRDLKELIGRVDRKTLTVAMKGTSDQLKNRIFGVMSQRSAEMLREDIEVIGAVRIREVEAAQQQIIALIREMEQEGSLSLQQSQYVV
ncbi:MAG TPA: flagellar motor switch protein FliG [Bryobacteraceae bacterium]|nr:flagellar motor switch protein FliG [Bryobacteraceae bacterium]